MPGFNEARIASLHIHPAAAGAPMSTVNSIQVVAEKGIKDNTRYFGRTSRNTGQPTRRQVTLIEREVIAEHATVLGLNGIPPGAVRANLETTGIDLVPLIGRQIQAGDAILLLCDARTPCHKMDEICEGLRGLMENRRQGVLAQVIRDGTIRVGDSIFPVG
jgi:MOSC domain-containing protein YiiM